ncbi:MAG: Tfp pilus assembly protein PilF [Candidatus Krumholzibacteriia bacterium]|jgi:Tfp pilus assembly protein PilF
MDSGPKTPQIPAEFVKLVSAGTAALNAGDMALALTKFESVISSFPNQPEGHNNLGALYSSIGDFARAEACFSRVVAILPDNTNVLFNRGVVRSSQEDFTGAHEDFEAVLVLSPNDADTLNNLGVTDFMQGRLAEASEYFTRALQEKPNYANALLNQVDVACANGNTAEAITICEDFLSSHASLDVRYKLLDLLSKNSRDALRKARDTAVSILIEDNQNESVRREIDRLELANSALHATA